MPHQAIRRARAPGLTPTFRRVLAAAIVAVIMAATVTASVLAGPSRRDGPFNRVIEEPPNPTALIEAIPAPDPLVDEVWYAAKLRTTAGYEALVLGS